MPTSYTPLLGLALPVQGELVGTWGDVVNASITNLVETSISGTTTLSTDADVTLTTTQGAANQARSAILLCSDARLAIRNITAPATSKAYTVINATTGGFAVVIRGVGPTTGVTVANGTTISVVWNGTDFVQTDAIAAQTVAATSKTTPVDADLIPLIDSAASNVLKKLTWANLKATAKTYFDTLYLGIGATAANASQLLGKTWAAPDPIGNVTPNSVAATTLSASGNATFSANAFFTDANRFIAASGSNLLLGADGGSGAVQFRADSAVRATISSTGIAVTGLLDISNAASGQIKFPATQNPSSDPNTLDDYEEVDWTPVIVGSSTAGSGTYTAQTGRCTKKGREVTCLATVGWSAHTGTGNMLLTGLPFTAQAGINPQSSVSCATMTVTGQVFLEIGQSTAGGSFFVVNNGALSSLAMDSAATVYLQFTYNV